MLNISKVALYLEYIAWMLRWHYAPESIPKRKAELMSKTQEPPLPPSTKPPPDEMQALRRIARMLELQPPAARARIVAYLNSYFQAFALPTDGQDPRD